jgi:hypothetical protein
LLLKVEIFIFFVYKPDFLVIFHLVQFTCCSTGSESDLNLGKRPYIEAQVAYAPVLQQAGQSE